MQAASIAATSDRGTPRVVPVMPNGPYELSPEGDSSSGGCHAITQHRAPVRKAEIEGTREFGRAQNGIRGPACWSRILCGRDRDHARRLLETDDLAGELEPARRPGAAQMVQPSALGEIRQAAADQRRRGLGERAGPIGHAKLIGDDGELVALRSQSPDRQQKVAAVQSVYPARAQRYVRAIHG